MPPTQAVSHSPSHVLLDPGPPFRGPDDVLRRFRAGDHLVLESVYRRYVSAVTTVVRGGLRATWQARRHRVDLATADLVQEVFLRAFAPAARRAFDGVREYGPYLYTVARNVVIDWARREGREVPTDWMEMVVLADAEPPTETSEVRQDPHLRAAMARYLDELDPKLRAVLDLRYHRGLSQLEGARALGVSRQSLRTMESRLHGGLRRALGRRQLGAD